MSFIKLTKNKYYGKVIEESTNAPLKNILVTDGRNVTRTDDNGEFSLNGYYNSHFIYITVPSNYECQSFYQAIKKDKRNYDFTLVKNNIVNDKEHKFIHISDTEIGKNEDFDWLERIKKDIEEIKPAFLIHTGDICYEYGLKKHIEIMNSNNMGCTVHYAIGNHDFVKGKYGEGLYESLYGPTWYSFEVGNIHYVVTPIRFGLDKMSGYMLNDSIKWLKNDIENTDKNKKVIVFNHTKCENDNYIYKYGFKKLDLKEHNLIGWFFGHYHYNFLYKQNDVLNISAPRPNGGGIDSSVAGYRIVNISKDDKISTKMKYYDLDKSSEPQDTIWQTKLNGNILFCNTICDNDNIYTATSMDDYPNDCGVYCIEKLSGNIKWYYKTINSIKNNIEIDNDNIIAMDCEGRIYCIDKLSGKLVWQRELTFDKKALGTSNAICINNGIIIAGNSSSIYAINIVNSNINWHRKYANKESSPSEFIIYDNKVFVSTHWDSLSCLDFATGKVLWKTVDNKIRFRSSAPTVLNEKTLIVAGDDTIMLVDINNGKIINSVSFENYIFSSSGKITVVDKTAYVPTMNKGLIAFDIENKKILWIFKGQNNILFSAPYANKGTKTIDNSVQIKDNMLYFGSNDGHIYKLNRNGELIKEYNAKSGILNNVLINDNKLYTATFNGYLCCYEL